MNHSTPIIEGCDLSIGYRSGKQVKTVHRHLNFSLHRGELTCLLGANGAGKSTLLRTLAATQMPLEGSLKLLGRPFTGRRFAIAGQAFAAVFGKGTFAHHRSGTDRQDSSRRADRL